MFCLIEIYEINLERVFAIPEMLKEERCEASERLKNADSIDCNPASLIEVPYSILDPETGYVIYFLHCFLQSFIADIEITFKLARNHFVSHILQSQPCITYAVD
jgi:hypothetical protein